LTETSKDQSRVLATPLEVQRARAILELISGPADVLPTTPDDEVLPFAIGLFDEFKAMRKDGVSISKLRKATSAYVHSRRYYLASARVGATRYSLDGSPVEQLNDRDRTAAKVSLQSLDEAHGRITTPSPLPPADKASRIKSGLLPRRERTDR
jgi:sRNA-binding protein